MKSNGSAIILAFGAILAGLAPGRANADWAPPPDYIARQTLPFFKDKSPEQIARYLAHFNDGPYTGAVMALAARGEEVVPLLEKLMGDSNPWIRAGAVDTLGELYKYEPKGKVQRKMTPSINKAIAMASRLLNDRHPAVQGALASFGEKIHIETPETRTIALRMANSPDAVVRSHALNMARVWIQDADTNVKIGMAVSAGPGNTGGDWNLAHNLIARYAIDPVCRQAIPELADFLRNKINTRPYRGFFTDGAQFEVLTILLDQWDEEVEKMPDVVPGICRVQVRAPRNLKFKGWVKTHALAKELLEKCTPVSAPAIRATVAEEKKWIADVPDLLLQTTLEVDPPLARQQVRSAIDDLEKLAAGLEAGNETNKVKK